jgi:hypothetical protein
MAIVDSYTLEDAWGEIGSKEAAHTLTALLTTVVSIIQDLDDCSRYHQDTALIGQHFTRAHTSTSAQVMATTLIDSCRRMDAWPAGRSVVTNEFRLA